MPVHSSLVVTHYTVRRMEKTEEPIMGGQCVIDEQLIIDILWNFDLENLYRITVRGREYDEKFELDINVAE